MKNQIGGLNSFEKEQIGKLKEFNDKVNAFFSYLMDMLEQRRYDQLDELVQQRDKLISLINDILYNRVKIIKKTQKGVKVSVTYIEMLSETKNLFVVRNQVLCSA